MGTEERYLTIREAAKELRVCAMTVWRWTVEGKIAFRQMAPGCKITIPLAEINRLQKFL